MPRHKLVRKRVNKLVKELKVFTTQEMLDRVNNYPNNQGRLYAKRKTVTKNQLANIIRQDKDVYIIKRHRKRSGEHENTILGYIGDEEE